MHQGLQGDTQSELVHTTQGWIYANDVVQPTVWQQLERSPGKGREADVDATLSEHVIGHSHKSTPDPRITLSRREQETLQWAAEGKTEWEIGRILGLSEHTASNRAD